MPAECFQQNPFDPRVIPITDQEMAAMVEAAQDSRFLALLNSWVEPEHEDD